MYSFGGATKKQMSRIRLSARPSNERHLSKPADERFQQDHQTNGISAIPPDERHLILR